MQSAFLTPLYAASYVAFFFLSFFASLKNAHRFILPQGSVSHSSLLLVLQAAGILLFFFLPFYFPHTTTLPLTGYEPHAAFAATLFLLLVMLFLSPRLAEKRYREQRNDSVAPVPPPLFIAVYFLLRASFIAAYEGWFRGYLLVHTIPLTGVPLAVALNVLLYALLHLVNGKKEMIACLPFGLLLCVLCLWQGAVWPAIALHLALTLPYELAFFKKIKSRHFIHEHTHYRRGRLHRA